MARQANGDAKGRGRGIEFVVADRVHFATDVLSAAERAAVLDAIASWPAFRAVSRSARGVGSSGDLLLARVTPGFRLLFRESPGRIEVLDVVNEETLRIFGVKTRAVRRPNHIKGRVSSAQ